jgi:hypothetical protein
MTTAPQSRDCRCEIWSAPPSVNIRKHLIGEIDCALLLGTPNFALDILRTHLAAAISGALL